MQNSNRPFLIAGSVASLVFLFCFFVALSPLSIWIQLPISLVLSLVAFVGVIAMMASRPRTFEEPPPLDESQTLAELMKLLPSVKGESHRKLSDLIGKASVVRAKLAVRGGEGWRSYIRPSLNIIVLATKDIISVDQGNKPLMAAYCELLDKHSRQLDSLLMHLDDEEAKDVRAALQGYQNSVEELGQIYNVGGTSA